MSPIKGPALFLAQFVQDVPPYDTLEHITRWAKDLGFIGVQIPADDKRLIDLDTAAESKQYCDDLKCCVKDSVQGAREGAEYIRSMLIEVPTRAFDDFAGGAQDIETNERILGVQR